MSTQTVGILHPGAMGMTVGAGIKAGGHRVVWASAGRSTSTRDRALQARLEDVVSLSKMVSSAGIIVSVCPPHAAWEVADAVIQRGFKGLYVDVNAISPATSRRINGIVTASGAAYIDGGIIGPPAHSPGRTRLYLSGARAGEIAPLFAQGNMEAIVIGGKPGLASALKMCYAAWTKGSSAMLLAIRALAEAEGVSEALLNEWKLSQPELQARSELAAAGSAPKAWRFIGEMEEIAASFKQAGLPDMFHLGAAELYGRLEGFKDQFGMVGMKNVLEELLKNHSAKENERKRP